MNLDFNLGLQVIGMAVTAGAIWGAIRADIKNIHERIDSAERMNKERVEAIHRRINDIKGAHE